MMSTSTRIFFCCAFILISTSACFARSVVPRRYNKISLGPVTITLESRGRSLPLFNRRGQYFVLGQHGKSYSVRIQNRTSRRLEVLVSIDGRDVINGSNAYGYRRRGYVLNPWRYVNISGFRVSKQQVAAFRFSTVPNSYAARRRTWSRIGSIEVAVFQEKKHISWRPHPPIVQPMYRSKKSGRVRGMSKSKRKTLRTQEQAPRHSRGKIKRRRYIRPDRNQPHLGTAYGEKKYAPVYSTTFRRLSSHPNYRIKLKYNNCNGFRTSGICSPQCSCYPRRWKYQRPIIQKNQNRRYAPPPQ